MSTEQAMQAGVSAGDDRENDAARLVRADGTVDWRALEHDALDGHPDAQQAVAEAIDAATRRRERFGVTRGLLLLLLELAPLLAFGLGVMAVSTSVYGQVIGAVLASVTALGYIVYQLVLRRWIERDIRQIAGTRVLFAWINSGLVLPLMAIVFGTLAVLSSGHAAEQIVFTTTAAVMIAAIAVALTTAARMRSLGRELSPEDMEQAMVLATPVGRSRAAVAALSEGSRKEIQDKIDEAVDGLLAAGTISELIARDAKAQPLGSLGRWELAMRAAARRG